MSNDRVYIKCTICKESKLLYKYYPTGAYVWSPETIGEWFEKHEDCLSQNADYAMFLEGFSSENPLFVFLTEDQCFKLKKKEEDKMACQVYSVISTYEMDKDKKYYECGNLSLTLLDRDWGKDQMVAIDIGNATGDDMLDQIVVRFDDLQMALDKLGYQKDG